MYRRKLRDHFRINIKPTVLSIWLLLMNYLYLVTFRPMGGVLFGFVNVFLYIFINIHKLQL